LSHTESALILRELYIDKYLPRLSDSVELCLGAVASRDTVNPIIDTRVQALLSDYIYLGVKDRLGISFDEYLSTTNIMLGQYRIYLEKLIDQENATLAEIKEINNGMEGDDGSTG